MSRVEDDKSVQAFEETKSSVVVISWKNRSYKVHGTGVILSKEGIIVSNYHVIEGARVSNLRVTFVDGTKYGNVEVLGRYKDLDLALLKVEAPKKKLRQISVGDSTKVRVGQHVYVIGHPHGLEYSFTTGRIGGLNRQVGTIKGLIQTDAGVEGGSSGGPILDSGKKLIGIITSMYSPGFAFAIPVNAVMEKVTTTVCKLKKRNEECDKEKLKHHNHNDVIRYLLGAVPPHQGYMILEELRLYGWAKMPNGDGNVLDCRGVCKQCDKIVVDILACDHVKSRRARVHAIVVKSDEWKKMSIAIFDKYSK